MVNALLTYVASYVNESSRSKMKNAILLHIGNDQITEARVMMQDAVRALLPNFKDIQGTRASSTQRDKRDIEADDICGAMIELQNLSADELAIPKFVTDDVKKIPKASPEEQSWLAMMDRVIRMENHLQQIESRVNSNTQDLKNQQTKVTALENKPTYAAVTMPVQQENIQPQLQMQMLNLQLQKLVTRDRRISKMQKMAKGLQLYWQMQMRGSNLPQMYKLRLQDSIQEAVWHLQLATLLSQALITVDGNIKVEGTGANEVLGLLLLVAANLGTHQLLLGQM